MSHPPFKPLVVGALYPAIERGLSADLRVAHALGGRALPVCTSHIVAGHGRVTDVLEVPADAVSAQLEHVFATTQPTGAKVGIVGSAASAAAIFRAVGHHLMGPLVFDLTLSGPSGEDLADGKVRESLVQVLPLPDLVTLRRADAELLVGMEITSLDDAQVAVQRMHLQGSRRVLLRIGTLPSPGAGQDETEDVFSVDLFYDGSDFALFEAPKVRISDDTHGASSALTLPILRALWRGSSMEEAIQHGKRFVTDALRRSMSPSSTEASSHYFAPIA